MPPLVIVAERLIDGTGRDPVERAAIVIEDGRITACGSRSSLSLPAGADVLEDDDVTVLPGFMDMHVHLAGNGANLVNILMTPPSLSLLNTVPNCAKTLAAGVTTVRDCGHTPVGVRMAAEAGYFPAPRMELAISILTQTGGHGDDLMPCGSRVGLVSAIDLPHGVVDGVDGMRHKVRQVLQAGADWIKLCTSGGVLSAGDLPEHPQFAVDEIRVAVEEAAAVGKRVAAHAMSAAGIRNALVAGVTTIEHGCLLDEACIALMKEKGAYLVPTLVAPKDVIEGAKSSGGLPQQMLAKAERVSGLHRKAVTAAIGAGVKVAMGTDAAVGPHGGNLRELGEMVRCGMTPMQAIEASTRVPAELLRRGDTLGTLATGKIADVVVVRGDPLADIDSLADPAHIRLVVKDGRVAYDFRSQQAAAQASSASASRAAS